MTTINPLSGPSGVSGKSGPDEIATIRNLVAQINNSPKAEGKAKATQGLADFLNKLSFKDNDQAEMLVRVERITRALDQIKDGSIRSEMVGILAKKTGE